jgi:glucosyl-3-phosphoglycerate synthase
VSVVIPALNEAGTIGPIVSAIRTELTGPGNLVDELVVVDSGSRDRTVAVAEAAGALVVSHADVLPGAGSHAGKGEALWKSLYVTSGDVLVFVDGDLEQFDPDVVTALLGPLLTDGDVHLVKAAYDRPLPGEGPAGGGRVTELVARPLLNLHWPLLAGVVQPLAGEYAARRELLERLPFAVGWGVELGLLVDALQTVGLDGLAQVDLGRRLHRHHADTTLGRMAAEVQRAALSRLHRQGQLRMRRRPATAYTTFERPNPGAGHLPQTVELVDAERPPMIELPEYASRRACAS